MKSSKCSAANIFNTHIVNALHRILCAEMLTPKKKNQAWTSHASLYSNLISLLTSDASPAFKAYDTQGMFCSGVNWLYCPQQGQNTKCKWDKISMTARKVPSAQTFSCCTTGIAFDHNSAERAEI